MRLNKLFVFLGFVVLLCTLSSRAEDDVADVEDEDEVESESENEPEDKASNNLLELLRTCRKPSLTVCLNITFAGQREKESGS